MFNIIRILKILLMGIKKLQEHINKEMSRTAKKRCVDDSIDHI